MSAFTESVVEEAALAWLDSLGWQNAHNLDIASGELRVKDAEKFIGRAV
jgi:hypothetical protein